MRKHSNKVNEVKQIRSCYDGDTKSNSGIYIYRLYEKDNQCARYICKKATKENFYHRILLGILEFKSGWRVNSNKEAGDGFSDILIRIDDSDVGIIIEVKYSENDTEDIECRKAITQIDQKKYADEFRDNGIGTIWKYGIVCNKKKCRVYDAAYEKA